MAPSEAWALTLREYFGFVHYKGAVLDMSNAPNRIDKDEADEIRARVEARKRK